VQRKSWRFRAIALAIALAWVPACGGGDSTPGTAGVGHAGGQPPLIEDLHLAPAGPIDGDVVRAVIRVRDPDGDSVEVVYEWEVGGMPQDETGPSIELQNVRKGTLVEVTARASDGVAESEPARQSVRVRNLRPTLTEARIEPWEMVDRGESLSVRADGSDPDGDLLTYRHRWYVNDRSIGVEGSSLSTADLSPGDVVHARVTASDGDNESDPIDTARVRVVGASPRIVSVPSGFSRDGTFRYTVEVEHPHGNAGIRFAVRTGPEGMWVNPVSGELTWRPEAWQKGEHPVEVEAKDSRGTVTVQAFTVTAGSASPPASRAPE
jgi:hypothetical protein